MRATIAAAMLISTMALATPAAFRPAIGSWFLRLLAPICRVQPRTMTRKLDHYTFSRRAIARFKCNDCGVNVIKTGDFYMLNPEIWEDQLHLSWTDNLCVTCLEKRIGRKISFADICSLPSVEGFPMSAVLVDRLFGKLLALEQRRKHRRKLEQARARKKRAALKKASSKLERQQ
jgi:hypothetical protein